MLINVVGQVDLNHRGIVLAESLVNQAGDFYDLTFGQALDEILRGEPVEVAHYQVDLQKSLEACKLNTFTAWTKTKVIFLNGGLFCHDVLLEYIPRNPPT